ncbi:MAG: polysaccharide biosynthesis tyrosine autokinase [bacterium]
MKANIINGYLDFYGLSDYPFNNSPDPRFFYPLKTHSSALNSLEYGVNTKKGLMIIIGGAGIGKTTLLRALISHFDKNMKSLLVEAPYINFKSLSAFILNNFEIHDHGLDEFAILQKIKDLLIYKVQNGINVVLLIDEAHCLDKEALKTIGFLSNLETNREKLLQIILAGQTGLKIELNKPEMHHLNQRIYFECHLDAFTDEEIYEYIDYRLQRVGSRLENIFSKEAFNKICFFSQGIPRLINLLCDKALLAGFNQQKKTIDEIIISQISFSFSPPPSPYPRLSSFPQSNAAKFNQEVVSEVSSSSEALSGESAQDDGIIIDDKKTLKNKKKNPGKLYIDRDAINQNNNYKHLKELGYNFLSSRLIDEYQKTKSNLDFFLESEMQSICIASANHREGTSTIASNFATALVTMEGHPTLLVDGNLRSPILHTLFEVDREPGFADIGLNGKTWRDMIKKTRVSNLFLITSGKQFSPTSNEPSHIFNSTCIRQMIEEIKSEFKYIIFDGAPINHYSDTTILAHHLGGVILTIQAGKTRREIVQNARFILDNAHINIIGAILNRRKYYIPHWIYKIL